MRKVNLRAISLFLALFFFCSREVFAATGKHCGGDGAGWGQGTASVIKYCGGLGAGHTVSSMSSDEHIGYGTATKLYVSTSPASTAAGIALSPSPVVTVQDAFSNPVPGTPHEITLGIAVDPVGGSQLSGTKTQTVNAQGLATFADLSLNKAGDGFSLRATSNPALTSDDSDFFSVVSPIQNISPGRTPGEIYGVGKNWPISWEEVGPLTVGYKQIQLSTTSATGPWDPPFAPAYSSPFEDWVPAQPAAQAWLKVTKEGESTFVAVSAYPFKIASGTVTVQSPNGTELLANGFAHTIYWGKTGAIPNVKLEYSGDGTSYNDILTSTPNDGNESWATNVTSGGTNFKIRISDATDPAINDLSNASFTVQKITVDAPQTPGFRVSAGTSLPIRWTAAGVSSVKIEYSRDGGTWTQITGAESIPAAQGSFSWDIPLRFPTSTNVRVLVSSTAADSCGGDHIASGTSAQFAIKGALAITFPDGSDWPAKTPQNIVWTNASGDIDNVKLEYSCDDCGSGFQVITNSTDNDLSESWTPDIVSLNYIVRISDAQDNLTKNESLPFKVTGMSINAPALNDTWNCGEAKIISWSWTGAYTHFKIEYSTNGADGPWNPIINDVYKTQSPASYSWTLTPSATLIPTTQALVRVSNISSSPSVTSEQFNIKAPITVTAPNGGVSQALEVGSQYNIAWTNIGRINNVTIEYFNGVQWVKVHPGNSIPNPNPTSGGTYTWTVPDTITGLSKVRVTDADSVHPASSDESDNTFSIKPKFDITSPTVGLNWAVNERHDITWNTTGTVNQVRLYYATERDGYNTWRQITTSAIANGGTYPWDVSNALLVTGQDPQADPNIAIKVKVVDATLFHPALGNTSEIFNVIYYTVTFNVLHVQTRLPLSGLSVTCSSGWSASGLTSGVNTSHNYPYGTYPATVWSKAEYEDAAVSGWTADASKSFEVLLIPSYLAEQEVKVFSNFTYDALTDSFLINSWLEKSGSTIATPASCTISMEDAAGNPVDINGAQGGSNLVSSAPNASGVFRMSWDLTNVNRATTYFGKVQIIYLGLTYASNVTYNIAVPQLAAVSKDVTDILNSVGTNLEAAVSGVGTAVSGVSGQVAAVQTDVTAIKTAVVAPEIPGGDTETLYSKVSRILGDTTGTLPQRITEELKKGVRAKILTRPSAVNPGDKIIVRYKTEPGLAADATNIMVYKPTNEKVLTENMSEIEASSGIYERQITFDKAWGIGDFTVVCSDSNTGSIDSMIVYVGAAISKILNKISSVSPGDAITVRFKTNPGLIPSLIISDAANSVRLAEQMTEIGSSGIYEKAVVFDKAWGIGDFTVECVESSTNTADSMVVKVGAALSKILPGPNTVDPGSSLTVRFKTNSGLAPTIKVYNPEDAALVTEQMTEIGSSGIYKYAVNFDPAWPNGDYSIECSEATTNSIDSTVVHVGQIGGIAGVASQINTLISEIGSGNIAEIKRITDTIKWDEVAKVTNITSIETLVNALSTGVNTVGTNVSNMNSMLGSVTDAAGANTLFGKIASVNASVGSITDGWGKLKATDIVQQINNLGANLGTPSDGTGTQTVFGKIATVSAQAGEIPSATSAANAAYNEIQALRKELDLNGKSETAYNLMNKINTSISEIKGSVGQIPAQAGQSQLKAIASTVEKTRNALKKIASESGVKGIATAETTAPDTLEGLQNQMSELKANMEIVKSLLQSKEEPTIKTWLEKE